jgi:hypothetical protein
MSPLIEESQIPFRLQDVGVKQIVNHHLWNKNTNAYDFSLLELSTPLTFSSDINKVALPEDPFGAPWIRSAPSRPCCRSWR